MLFKLRCRVNICKANYKSSYVGNMKCIFCEKPDTTDCERHYLTCQKVISMPDIHPDIISIKYEDIFSDIPKQVKFVKVWMTIENMRKKVTDKYL